MFWPFYVDILLFFLMLASTKVKFIKQKLNLLNVIASFSPSSWIANKGNKTSVTIEVLFVSPGVSDVFLLQYTVSDLNQKHTKNSNFIRDKIVYRWYSAN
jgi:hypothetical protein